MNRKNSNILTFQKSYTQKLRSSVKNTQQFYIQKAHSPESPGKLNDKPGQSHSKGVGVGLSQLRNTGVIVMAVCKS